MTKTYSSYIPLVSIRQSKIGNPKAAPQTKWVGIFAIVVALTVCGARAEGQQPAKVSRIGYLSTNSITAMSTRTGAVQKGLRTWIHRRKKHCH